jgi:hypothetical protein
MTCTQPPRNSLGLFGFLPLSAAIRHFLDYSEETNPRRAQIQLLAGCAQLGLAAVAFGAAYLL